MKQPSPVFTKNNTSGNCYELTRLEFFSNTNFKNFDIKKANQELLIKSVQMFLARILHSQQQKEFFLVPMKINFGSLRSDIIFNYNFKRQILDFGSLIDQF